MNEFWNVKCRVLTLIEQLFTCYIDANFCDTLNVFIVSLKSVENALN